MDLVVDANIIIAALLKDGVTYQLFFSDRLRLFTTEYIFDELQQHSDELLQKTKRTVDEFHQLLDILHRRMIVIPALDLRPFVHQAEHITPDADDLVYFALALKLGCGLWSNDKVLKTAQAVVPVFSTKEIVVMLRGR